MLGVQQPPNGRKGIFYLGVLKELWRGLTEGSGVYEGLSGSGSQDMRGLHSIPRCMEYTRESMWFEAIWAVLHGLYGAVCGVPECLGATRGQGACRYL